MPSESLETEVKGPGGRLALEARIAKSGRTHYWIMWHRDGSSRQEMVPVFGNEMSWFLDSLDALATEMPFDEISEDGTYPLASLFKGSDGVAWDAECREETITLNFRRFKNSIRRNKESFYTRYFVPSRIGRFQQKTAIPRQFIEDGYFGEFVKKIRVNRDRVRDCLLRTLSPPPEGELDPFTQVVLEGKLVDYATESLSQAESLKHPVVRTCLDLCEDEQSAQELSDRIPLHIREIEHLLDWTRRYDPTVLSEAFLFSPRIEQTGKIFFAVRQPDVFRCDPLLSCLNPDHPPREGYDVDENWLSAPQSTPSGFQKAIDSGYANGFFSTTWGRAPIPDENEAGKIRRYVRMHSSMKVHRWKILQLAWRASAEINNFPGGISQNPVLGFQCMGFLRSDVATFFENELEHLQQMMQERMSMALAGETCATRTNEWEELPRKEE